METATQLLESAWQHHRANRLTQAEQSYRQVLAMHVNQPDALHGLGMLALQVGKHQTAEELFQTVLRALPDSAKTWLALGNVRQAQKRWDEAIACYQHAVRVRPDWADARSSLGNALRAIGKAEQAVEHYERAVALAPDNGQLQYELGCLYQTQEQYEAAASAFRHGLQLTNPRYVQAAQDRTVAQTNAADSFVSLTTDTQVGGYCFPTIPLVPDNPERRPFWSVMIPAYNRTQFLLECLASVLAQWPGEDEMEIVVIDNGSTPPLRELVHSVGRDIVRYHRHPQTLPLQENWNSAVALSRGEWVHLLHDDDYVLPGFYAKLKSGLETCPDSVGAAFSGYENINENGVSTFSCQIYDDYRGIAHDWLAKIGVGNLLNPPAAVIRRAAYERLGGYSTDILYTIDWELYTRVASFYDWWCEPDILVHYRQHAFNVSSEQTKAGAQGEAHRLAIEMSESYLPPAQRAEITAKARRNYFQWCLAHLVLPVRADNLSGAMRLLQETLKIDHSAVCVAEVFAWLNTNDGIPLQAEVASRCKSIAALHPTPHSTLAQVFDWLTTDKAAAVRTEITDTLIAVRLEAVRDNFFFTDN